MAAQESEPLKEVNKALTEKEELVGKGLHLDWLIRAQRTTSVDGLVYLFQQKEKFANEDQKAVLKIIQDYEKSGKEIISENDPPSIQKRRRLPVPFGGNNGDSSEVYRFTCKFFELVKEEPVVWDKTNSAEFGFHQPMRQAWCRISLSLGGWGLMRHVHLLKQYYRRKRDQYNTEHLRLGRPFQYSEELSFLKNVLEVAKSELLTTDISLEEHIKLAAPDIVYESEISEAPFEIQEILRQVSEAIDEAEEKFSPEVFAEYLSACCNEVVRNREELSTTGLRETDSKESINLKNAPLV